ncbi:unnamed protein product [Coffea canephora]|uniref:Uncharacterized protein n=1 Tax=Coffea canephora TaxID=49390 RepID=A0A068V6T1_COFCA|nr:unnamed protein product [Coffea canephora]
MFKLLILILALCPSAIDSSFQYFNMVEQWPGGYCQFHRCRRVPWPNDFTIHGLWPANHTGTVENCKKTGFAPIQDENKFKQLDSIWPNLDQPRPEYDRLGSRVLAQSFWGHEWNKHGTCSENMYNQTQYFDLAIKLKNRYNLLSILEQGGLSRGHSHELSDVNSTIWRTTHGTPDLKCLNDARVHRNVPVLQEIGICYRPSKNRSGQVSFSVINCPHSRTRTCYRGLGNGKIVFP